MKTLYGIVLLFFFTTGSLAQSQESNLEKYWNQRDRFRKQFCEIGNLILHLNTL